MLLPLWRAWRKDPCTQAASVGAAAAADTNETGSRAHTAAINEPDPPEPDPDMYPMEIGEIYTRSLAHDHHFIAAGRPEVPMQWTEPAVYCRTCQFWLNGQQQWKDHISGKKHRKNVRRKRDFIRIDNPQQHRQKLRIPYLASSKATINPVTVWLVEQERAIRDEVQRREQEHLRMNLREVVQAWFNFVFVGSDSEYDVTDFLLDIDDAP